MWTPNPRPLILPRCPWADQGNMNISSVDLFSSVSRSCWFLRYQVLNAGLGFQSHAATCRFRAILFDVTWPPEGGRGPGARPSLTSKKSLPPTPRQCNAVVVGAGSLLVPQQANFQTSLNAQISQAHLLRFASVENSSFVILMRAQRVMGTNGA